MTDKKKVIIFINDLKTGGAQNTLKRVVGPMKEKYVINIVTFFTIGPVGKELEQNGFNIIVFDKWKLLHLLSTLRRIYLFLREKKPEVIISFLYFSDLIGGVIGKLAARRTKIIWNVRNDLLKFGDTGAVTFIISRINLLLSYFIPDRIIYCSIPSMQSHTKIGYRQSIGTVCENNINTSLYAFNPKVRSVIREQKRLLDNIPLFCMACRYDRIKNIPLYLKGIRYFFDNFSYSAYFLICGQGMSLVNEELSKEIEAAGVSEKIHLSEYVENMPQFLSAIDCVVVTSKSEGSPNIVYEAMASGAYCIMSNLPIDRGRITENVEVVPDFSASSFAKAFADFCENYAAKNRVRFENSVHVSQEPYRHNLSKVLISYIDQ